jgi:hypothetical protein
VILQEIHSDYVKAVRHEGSQVHNAKTKWMKRFERSQLLLFVPRDTRAYRWLVNPKTS